LLQRRLAEAQESERSRISRELHDRLGQDLTGLNLGLQALRRKSPASAQGELTRLEQLCRQLMRDIHRLAWELRPTALDDLGLDQALQRYVSDWSGSADIPVDFHGPGPKPDRLPLEVETVLYRVTQEALANIARHANARRVSILLENRAGAVSLIIEDDGRGFDVDALMGADDGEGRLGLLGMQERVALVGGSFQIESSPGAGTTLFVRLILETPRSGEVLLPGHDTVTDSPGRRPLGRP